MRVLYFSFFIVIIDQITKFYIKGIYIPFLDFYHQGMMLGESYSIIGDFLKITFVENPGIAFGIEIGGRLFLTILSIIICFGILFYLYQIRKENLISRITLATILGGAIGNLIDRIFYGVIFGEAPLFYGKVVDFIDVDFFKIDIFNFYMDRFPVFNIADSCVSIGIVLMLIFNKKFSDIKFLSNASKNQ